MIIQTERLILRPFECTDKIWYYELVQNEELKKWLPSLEATSFDEASKCVDIFMQGNFRDDYYYVIEDNEKNVIGILIAVRITRNTIDVAYFLKEEYRHRGFMTETLKVFTNEARKENFMRRFRMVIELENAASLSVVKRLGANIQIHNGKYICYY